MSNSSEFADTFERSRAKYDTRRWISGDPGTGFTASSRNRPKKKKKQQLREDWRRRRRREAAVGVSDSMCSGRGPRRKRYTASLRVFMAYPHFVRYIYHRTEQRGMREQPSRIIVSGSANGRAY